MRRSAVFALLGLAMLAGCDSSTRGNGAPAAPSSGSATSATPSSGSATASAPNSGSGAPAPSSAPPGSFGTPAPPPHAADGTNVAACADGRCEVIVRAGTAIPVPKSMDVEKVTVSAVTRSRVTVTGHDLGNSSGGSCTGQCDSSSSNGHFKIALGANSAATENGLALTVEQIAGQTAVVEVSPAG